MAAKAEDRRVQRTRKVLQDALVELMLEKGYEAVTVQDIIDRANVGRSTFYAHFLDKQALLQSGFEQLHQFLAELVVVPAAASGTDRPALCFSLAMFQHVESYHRVWQAIVGKQGGAIVQREIQRLFADLVQQELAALVPSGAPLPVPLAVVVEYTVSAYMGLLAWWLEQKLPCSAAEMDRRFRALTMPGITAALGLTAPVLLADRA